mgnify:FL=1
MKTTNQIEEALKDKIDFEIANIVKGFIDELKGVYDTYGGTSWYKIVHSARGYDKDQEINCLTTEEIRTVLQKMIQENHGKAMLKKKTKQLLAKLEIL